MSNCQYAGCGENGRYYDADDDIVCEKHMRKMIENNEADFEDFLNIEEL